MKFLFIIFVIILVFQILFRWVIPYLLKRKLNKMQDNYSRRNKEYRNQDKSEGEVTIEDIPEERKRKKRKSKSTDEEELADYEEIE